MGVGVGVGVGMGMGVGVGVREGEIDAEGEVDMDKLSVGSSGSRYALYRSDGVGTTCTSMQKEVRDQSKVEDAGEIPCII